MLSKLAGERRGTGPQLHQCAQETEHSLHHRDNPVAMKFSIDAEEMGVFAEDLRLNESLYCAQKDTVLDRTKVGTVVYRHLVSSI